MAVDKRPFVARTSIRSMCVRTLTYTHAPGREAARRTSARSIEDGTASGPHGERTPRQSLHRGGRAMYYTPPGRPRLLDLVRDRLQQQTGRLRGLVEASLAGVFRGDTVLDRAARHLLFGEGKLVRASLALIGMEAAGGRAATAVRIATAFELLHTASLIHDDIMDAAEVRRGRECVHRVFGTRMAITAGDALIFEAYRHVLLLGE